MSERFIGKTDHPIAALTCPHCGYRVDAASGIDHDGTPPAGSAFAICIKCAQVSILTEGKTLRRLTADEAAEAAADRSIAEAQYAIRWMRLFMGPVGT